MTAAQMAMRYNGWGPELPCVFPTSWDEQLSNGDGLGPGETQGEEVLLKIQFQDHHILYTCGLDLVMVWVSSFAASAGDLQRNLKTEIRPNVCLVSAAPMNFKFILLLRLYMKYAVGNLARNFHLDSFSFPCLI